MAAPTASQRVVTVVGLQDVRVCPWCAETIKAAAVICRFCSRDIEPINAGRTTVTVSGDQRRESTGPVNLDPVILEQLRVVYGDRNVSDALQAFGLLELQPANPEMWFEELCIRVQSGAIRTAAASRIPLDFSS